MNGSCASFEQLEQIARGEDVGPDTAEHVRDCAVCLERLDDVRANNGLADELTAIADEPEGGIDQLPALERKGYRVIRELHRGGQGVVYLGEHTPTGRRVAIKTLLVGRRATPRQRARFEREAELLAGMRHAGIVTVFDSGIADDGQAYLVMEYLEGRPLDEWLADPDAGARRSLRERLSLFERLCGAVNAAHVRGVIHRDLKPQNILIDAQDNPRVLDFGVARAIEQSAEAGHTRQGDFVGTLLYAAPEQLERDPARVDTRTDVYALGLILHELLAGVPARPPGLSIAELARLVTDDPPRPSARCSAIDDDVDTLVVTALAPERSDRYQSVAALREDVQRYLAGRAIHAKRGRKWYVARKFIVRHKLPIGAGVVLAATLAGAAVVSLALLRESRIENAKANGIRVFLEDTLGSVEPDPFGGDPRVGDVLDEAVHWIEIALSDEPEVAASLHDTIGNSYRVLGRFADAEAQLVAAMDIRRDLFGERHAEFATSLNRMATLRADQGRLDEAERLARGAIDIRERVFGRESDPVASALMNLGSILLTADRRGESVAVYQRALGVRQKLRTAPHPDIAMCDFRLGEAFADSDVGASLRHHERALETRRATLHADHPDLIRSMRAVAEARIAAGRAGSVEVAERLVETVGAAHGEANWQTARAMLVLGRALVHEGRREEALATVEHAHGYLEHALGVDHPETRKAGLVLAQLRAGS